MLSWLGKTPSIKSARKPSTKRKTTTKKTTRYVIVSGKPRAVVQNPKGNNYYNRKSADGKVRKMAVTGMKTYSAADIKKKAKSTKK